MNTYRSFDRNGNDVIVTVPDADEESVLSIRLYNARQVALDLATRLNDLHREACTSEPYLAELLLPLTGHANRSAELLARWMEVRK